MTKCSVHAMCTQCAHDRPVTVHYVVHYLGYCSWTLLKKSTKMTPGNWGVTYLIGFGENPDFFNWIANHQACFHAWGLFKRETPKSCSGFFFHFQLF